jgi:ABC-type lipoprotein export system ATPase subunit
MQVVFATHHLPLQQVADRVYHMSEKDGTSSVKAT